MLSFDLFAAMGIILIFILLGILFVIPTDRKRYSFRKKRRLKKDQEAHKDWQAVSLKLEKHIYALRNEIESEQKRIRILERELLVQKEKSKKLQDKIAQERGWQKKEKTDIEKRTQEVIRLKADLKKAEQNLEKEHGQRLKFEREVREMSATLSKSMELKRNLEIQIAKMKAQGESYRKELVSLREENAKLTKKHEDATFVAKSEYEKIEKLLKQKERELENFKRRIQREME